MTKKTKIHPSLHSQISALQEKFGEGATPSAILPDFTSLTVITEEWDKIQTLSEKFKHKPLSNENKTLIEEYKLFLMQMLYAKLCASCHAGDVSPLPQKDPSKDSFSFKKYFTFLFSGLLMNLVHGFVSSISLLGLISALSNPVLLILSSVMSILNGFTYYFFEGYLLKKNLGIPILTSDVKKTLAVYDDQLTATEKLNRALFNIVATSHLHKREEYPVYAKLAVQMNKSVQANKHLFKTYKEKKSIRGIRLGFMIFGSTMAAGTGFFALKALLTIIALPLLGTPVGWGLLAAAAVLSVVIHLGLKPKRMFNTLNPTAQKFKMIQEKYTAFKARNGKDFRKVMAHQPQIVNIAKPATNSVIYPEQSPEENPRFFSTKRALPRSKSAPDHISLVGNQFRR